MWIYIEEDERKSKTIEIEICIDLKKRKKKWMLISFHILSSSFFSLSQNLNSFWAFIFFFLLMTAAHVSSDIWNLHEKTKKYSKLFKIMTTKQYAEYNAIFAFLRKKKKTKSSIQSSHMNTKKMFHKWDSPLSGTEKNRMFDVRQFSEEINITVSKNLCIVQFFFYRTKRAQYLYFLQNCCSALSVLYVRFFALSVLI